MCIKAVEKNPWMLKIVPAQEMCTTAVHMEPYILAYVLDRFKTQGMCIKAVGKSSYQLCRVRDQYKTQEMCDKSVRE